MKTLGFGTVSSEVGEGKIATPVQTLGNYRFGAWLLVSSRCLTREEELLLIVRLHEVFEDTSTVDILARRSRIGCNGCFEFISCELLSGDGRDIKARACGGKKSGEDGRTEQNNLEN